MGLFGWLLGGKDRNREQYLKASHEAELLRRRAALDAQEARAAAEAAATAKGKTYFDAMIEAQRDGGGSVEGGVRLTADGQVNLDAFDLTAADAAALERFKATHNGGFEPSFTLTTATVDPVTQQQMVAGLAKLPPDGQADPTGKVKLDMNEHGTVMARVEDIPSAALETFRASAGLNGADASARPVTDEDKALLDALAKIGAEPRNFQPR